MFGATIFSAVMHVAAIAATVIVWPYVAPPIELPSDVVPVELLEPGEETNITPQQEAEEPPPEPIQTAMPDIPIPPPPEFEEPPPPPIEDEAPAIEPEPAPPEPVKPQPPQPKMAMFQPRAKPKPEPKKPEFDLSKIDEAIKRAEKQQPKTEAEAPPLPAKQALKGAGAQSAMTMSEIDALRSQMSKCWNVPVGAPDPTALVLRVRVFLNEDGTVASAPQLIDQARLGDPYFRAAADAAIRAIHICGPYELPPEKYSHWSEIVITFDPRQMAGY